MFMPVLTGIATHDPARQRSSLAPPRLSRHCRAGFRPAGRNQFLRRPTGLGSLASEA
ncbi:hypothetical protein GCM10009565_73860 [Amycolatopsis albidoflavus]